MNQTQRFREKIFGGRRKGKEFTEDDLILAHDLFMVEYGWIPVEEFAKIPLPTFWNLLNRIKERREAEAKEYKKMKKPRMPRRR